MYTVNSIVYLNRILKIIFIPKLLCLLKLMCSWNISLWIQFPNIVLTNSQYIVWEDCATSVCEIICTYLQPTILEFVNLITCAETNCGYNMLVIMCTAWIFESTTTKINLQQCNKIICCTASI
jgi:hypothetical protein